MYCVQAATCNDLNYSVTAQSESHAYFVCPASVLLGAYCTSILTCKAL